MSKRAVIAGAVLVGIAAAVVVLRGDDIEVTVAQATRDTLSVTIPAEGRTRPRERFTVTAPASGRITRLELEEGDLVEEGQLLARLYAAPQDPRVAATTRADLQAAEARRRQAGSLLQEARMEAAQAEREMERRRPLAEMGAITRERMEQAELAATVAEQRLEAAEAEVEAARAAVASARSRLAGMEDVDDGTEPLLLEAPVSGRVLDVPDESARVVAAGTPLLTLGGIGGLEIVLDVLSEDAVQVEAGNPIVLTGWGGEDPLHGTVRTVTQVGYTKVSALGVEEQRVDVVGDLDNPPASLGAGYRVSGEIVVWEGDGVLSVPTSALFRDGGSWRLFVDDDGTARLREVTVGHRNDQAAEIVSGVDEGARVILFPPEAVEDGVGIEATPR